MMQNIAPAHTVSAGERDGAQVIKTVINNTNAQRSPSSIDACYGNSKEEIITEVEKENVRLPMSVQEKKVIVLCLPAGFKELRLSPGLSIRPVRVS